MNNYYKRVNNNYQLKRNNANHYDPYSYPENLPTALELIEEAVEVESRAEAFYEYLISIAPYEDDKKIIRSIRDDERSHNKLFRRIYYELTCQMLPESENGDFTVPETYCQGLKMALENELNAVRKYRQIYYAMCYRTHMNIMTGIITDELRHADYINFLYSKNECYEEELAEKEENEDYCK